MISEKSRWSPKESRGIILTDSFVVVMSRLHYPFATLCRAASRRVLLFLAASLPISSPPPHPAKSQSSANMPIAITW